MARVRRAEDRSQRHVLIPFLGSEGESVPMTDDPRPPRLASTSPWSAQSPSWARSDTTGSDPWWLLAI
jgi:hypothetical protein